MSAHRRPAARIGLTLGFVLLFAVFVALGSWQVQRRAWKLDLIARVDERVHAAPVAITPPVPPSAWQQVTAAGDEYRAVRLTGHYLDALPAKVQAVTVRGSGYWLLSPLQVGPAVDSKTAATVLVNRGFIPADQTALPALPPGEVTVTGLLRITEPGGGFLRKNDVAADRWFSRDVAAIAASRQLAHAAPWFVDAAAAPAEAEGQPVGGLTVIAFHNSHLVYAVTWFTLALMVAGAGVVLARQNAQRHDDPAAHPD